MSTSSPHIYQPLGEGRLIRVLKLQHGLGDDVLSCTLTTVSLDEDPIYFALSYVWGPSNENRTLSCSGQLLPITDNLHSALLQLRRKNLTDYYFWIDALCINQADIGERTKQVQMMGDIYTRAQGVVVWLGIASECDSLAGPYIEWMLALCSDYAHLDYGEFHALLSRSIAQYDPEGQYITQFAHLLTRPWFSRVWVIQEVAKASNAFFMCGPQVIKVHSFFRVFHTVVKHGLLVQIDTDLSRATNATRDNIITIHMCMNEVEEGSVNLFNTLCRARGFQCTDPRDKLYALLGMTMPTESLRVQVDYSRPWPDVFQEVAISDIIDGKQLRMLSCTTSKPSTVDETIDLPSWVPNWTQHGDRISYLAHSLPFKADGNEEATIRLTSDGNVLVVKGKLLGHLETVGPVFDRSIPDLDPEEHSTLIRRTAQEAKRRLTWLQECHQVAFGNADTTISTHDIATNNSFLRALMSEIDVQTWKPPSEETIATLRRYCSDLPAIVQILDRLVYPDNPAPTDESEITILNNFITTTEMLISDIFTLSANQRRFCRTDTGYLGYVPIAAEPGDIVAVLYGGKVLYVLRPVEGDHYRLIGESFLQGVMYGEAVEMTEIPEREFLIR